jgi:hypothetical protein
MVSLSITQMIVSEQDLPLNISNNILLSRVLMEMYVQLLRLITLTFLSLSLSLSAYHSVILSASLQFFTSTGSLITSCHEMTSPVFFVPSQQPFIWPSFELGHRVTLPDIIIPSYPSDEPVSLTTLSLTPKIFLLKNFISSSEGSLLIEYMNNKSTEDDGLEISLVGSEAVQSQRRTSSNGWDSESTVRLPASLSSLPSLLSTDRSVRADCHRSQGTMSGITSCGSSG